MLEKRDFYIDGVWRAPKNAQDFEVINPSDETPCAVISLGGQEDTDYAVSVARRAFNDWAQTALEERISYIEKLSGVLERRADEMAELISMEMGAPIDLARTQQATSGGWHLDGFLHAVRDMEFAHPLGAHASNEYVFYEPIGVVAQITPWNWPINQISLKTIPALLAGCTMVLKPSEIAPLSGMLFAEFLDEIGLPDGVFNLINGDGVGVGTQLSQHKDVDMISFTGSTRAGIAISKNAADGLKRVSLELGGKGANIIFADAHKEAVRRGVLSCFNNSGQSCNAPTRMLVERSRYAQALDEAQKAAAEVKIGMAAEEGRHIGPVVSKVQFDKIQNLIQKGIKEGARLIAGGTGRPEGLNRGYFVKPTVFADMRADMQIFREEIFGPVLGIMPFDTEEEAIMIANDTEYGLTNYIETADKARAQRIARKLRSGMVKINGTGFAQGSPFGGYKKSGNGREGGRFGIEDFLEIKAVSAWE